MKWSQKTLYPKSSLRTRPLSCASHTTVTNQENIVSPCTWTRSVTTSTNTKLQHTEFMNFMNEHCSQWSPNDHVLQTPIFTVCGQYCVAFLMFRCCNISMHAFARLFTSDLFANPCRVHIPLRHNVFHPVTVCSTPSRCVFRMKM